MFSFLGADIEVAFWVRVGCGRVFDLFYDREVARGRVASRWPFWCEFIGPDDGDS